MERRFPAGKPHMPGAAQARTDLAQEGAKPQRQMPTTEQIPEVLSAAASGVTVATTAATAGVAAVHDPPQFVIETPVPGVTPIAPVTVAGIDKRVVATVKAFGAGVGESRANTARVPCPIRGGLRLPYPSARTETTKRAVLPSAVQVAERMALQGP